MPLIGIPFDAYYALPSVLAAIDKIRPLVAAGLSTSTDPPSRSASSSSSLPNAKEIAAFLAHLRKFQEDALGPVTAVEHYSLSSNTKKNASSSSSLFFVKIPAKLFKETFVTFTSDSSSSSSSQKRKRSSLGYAKSKVVQPSPILALIVACAYRYKKQKGIKRWEFPATAPPSSPPSELNRRKSASLALLAELRQALVESGYIVSPRIAFASNLNKKLVSELTTSIQKLKGTIATDHSKATHVIYPPDEQDYSNQEFYRTLEKKDGYVCLHYWYRPDSSDVWCLDSPDFLQPEPPPEHVGPWMVHAKWLTDSLLYNEWMNEEDYEVPEDQRTTNGGTKSSKMSIKSAAATMSASENEDDSWGDGQKANGRNGTKTSRSATQSRRSSQSNLVNERKRKRPDEDSDDGDTRSSRKAKTANDADSAVATPRKLPVKLKVKGPVDTPPASTDVAEARGARSSRSQTKAEATATTPSTSTRSGVSSKLSLTLDRKQSAVADKGSPAPTLKLSKPSLTEAPRSSIGGKSPGPQALQRMQTSGKTVPPRTATSGKTPRESAKTPRVEPMRPTVSGKQPPSFSGKKPRQSLAQSGSTSDDFSDVEVTDESDLNDDNSDIEIRDADDGNSSSDEGTDDENEIDIEDRADTPTTQNTSTTPGHPSSIQPPKGRPSTSSTRSTKRPYHRHSYLPAPIPAGTPVVTTATENANVPVTQTMENGNATPAIVSEKSDVGTKAEGSSSGTPVNGQAGSGVDSPSSTIKPETPTKPMSTPPPSTPPNHPPPKPNPSTPTRNSATATYASTTTLTAAETRLCLPPSFPSWFSPSEISSYELSFFPSLLVRNKYAAVAKAEYIRARNAMVAVSLADPEHYLDLGRCWEGLGLDEARIGGVPPFGVDGVEGAGEEFAVRVKGSEERVVSVEGGGMPGTVVWLGRIHGFLEMHGLINGQVRKSLRITRLRRFTRTNPRCW
ncbi:hypothetical protein BJ742DRAFT_485093 [Cladochytrium replicatum]|nr:hypothetical protein BJ742DRAFT_485093 [Cladochytrium replicatum]